MAVKFNQNRLRFVHCENIFATAADVKTYIEKSRVDRPYLFAEPCLYLYGEKENPNIILTIGTVGDGTYQTNRQGEMVNRTYIIDFNQIESDIKKLVDESKATAEEIQTIKETVTNVISACGFDEKGNYVKAEGNKIIGDANSLFEADRLLSKYILSIDAKTALKGKETSSIKPTVAIAEDGTTISADVKLGTKVFDGKVLENLIVTREDGIFFNIDMDYKEDTSEVVLTVNGGHGTDKGFIKTVPIPTEIHPIALRYDKYKEELVVELNKETTLKNGKNSNILSISTKNLIDEIGTVGTESETPLVLTKKIVKTTDADEYGNFDEKHAITGDIRLSDASTNILKKTEDGKALIVDGSSKNIKYGDKSLKSVLDNMNKYTKIAADNDNIIKLTDDGLYADVDVSYDKATNKLYFRNSATGETKYWVLNSTKFIEVVTYDPKTHTLHIKYLNTENNIVDVPIDLSQVLKNWTVDNNNRTVKLIQHQEPDGAYRLTADVNVAKNIEHNILEVKEGGSGAMLYVNGVAKNIFIDSELFESNNVEDALNELETNNKANIEKETTRAKNIEDGLSNSLKTEKERALEAEGKLNKSLTEAKYKLTKNFVDSQSIVFKEVSREDGSKDIKATVVIDNDPENLLAPGDNALCARAHLDYNHATRILSLRGSNGIVSQVTLPSVLALEDIHYDSVQKQLVILYVKQDGMKYTEKIPIGDLFNEWRVDNTNGGAITLTKTKGVQVGDDDLLSAEVNVSKLTSNLLVNDNGNLYVPNSANKLILADGSNLEDTVRNLLSKDIALEQAIKDETARSVNKEGEIKRDLTDEVSRAISAEQTLSGLLQTEISRSISEDKSIRADLNSTNITLQKEIDRAQDSEKTITFNLEKETNRATQKETDLERLINQNTEAIKSNSTKDEETLNKLDGKIDGEIVRAKSEEKRLNGLIDTNKAESDKSISELKEADKEINRTINSISETNKTEIGSVKETIKSLSEKVDSEIDRSEKKDAELVEKDTQLNKAIDEETQRAKKEEGDIKQLVADEKTRAIHAEEVLETKIGTSNKAVETEKDRALEAEKNLKGSIDKNTKDIEEEVKRASEADIENAELAKKAYDLANVAKDEISEETRRAQNGEYSLAQQIDREANDRITAISDLNNSLNAEKQARTQSFDKLVESIINEKNTSIGRETEISKNVTANTKLINDTKAELVKVDNAQNGRLDTLEKSVKEEATRATKEDEKLNSELGEVNGLVQKLQSDTDITFGETSTVSLVKGNDKVVKATAKVSATDKNILKIENDGLFATTDLSYDIAQNKLTLTSSNGVKSEVTLQSVSVIKNISYLPASSEIQITYTDGQNVERTVKFPADNLFKPIKAENTNKNIAVEVTNKDNYVVSANLDVNGIIDNTSTTVELTKTDNNKIKANVKVSDREGNALKIDNKNLLYVSNKVDDIENTVKTDQYGKTLATALTKIYETCQALKGDITKIDSVEFKDNVFKLNYLNGDGVKQSVTCNMNLDITDKITAKDDEEHNVKFTVSKQDNKTLIIGNVERFDCGEY